MIPKIKKEKNNLFCVASRIHIHINTYYKTLRFLSVSLREMFNPWELKKNTYLPLGSEHLAQPALQTLSNFSLSIGP